MTETTWCVNCRVEFEYSPILLTAEDFDDFERFPERFAPEFCDGCDFDPLDEMDFLEHP